MPNDFKTILVAGNEFAGSAVSAEVLQPDGSSHEAFNQLARYAEDLRKSTRARQFDLQQLRSYVKDLLSVIAQRNQAMQDAAVAAEAKHQLLCNISHEFRTPLASIMGYSEFLVRTAGDEKSRTLLACIYNSGKRLERLVTNLLTLARSASGSIEVTMVPCDIVEIARSQWHAFDARAREKGLEFILDIPVHPVKKAIVDELRITRALAEIIDNALRFTPNGSVTMRVNADPDTHVPQSIEVEDTGVGIHRSDQQRIRDVFERVDGGNAQPPNGAGIGLALAVALVEIQGCQLHITSEVAKGSIFKIVLAKTSPQTELPRRSMPESQ